MRNLRPLQVIPFFLLIMGIILVGSVLAASDEDAVACPTCSWTSGETSVSHLSHEEFQKLLGEVLPDWYREWWEQLPRIEAPKDAKFDSVFDWRVHQGPYGTTGVTGIRNQGDCGSCWAFAGVAHLESMVKIYAELDMNLSEQQVVSCVTPGHGCEGWYTEAAYDLFRDEGSAHETCMPYHANDTDPCIQEQCEKFAKLSGYRAVAEDVNSIKTALMEGPVKSSMAVEDTFQTYTGGCYDKPYNISNHAVLIVGWDDTMCDGEGAWIVKNSWGPGWGDNGYYYIKYGCCRIGTNVVQIDYYYHRPFVRFEYLGTDDGEPGGDGDGKIEAGETVSLEFTLKNLATQFDAVEVTVTADTTGVVMTDDYCYLGNLDSKDTVDNSSDPMQFYVPEDFPPRRVYFTFHVEGTYDGVTYTADSTLETFVGSTLLLVDDDQGEEGLSGNYESCYTGALDLLKGVYDLWDKGNYPDSTVSYSQYKTVIWFTGDHRDSVFSHADVESLMTFLDQGGRLFLTSQDAVECLAASGDPLFSEFMTDYLHLGYDGNCTGLSKLGAPGKAGDEIGDELYMYLSDASSPENQTSADMLVPDSEADTVCSYAGIWWATTEDSVAGIKYVNDFYKVVVFGFGFDGLNTDGLMHFGRVIQEPQVVMQRVLDWLQSPGPTVTILYPNGGETCIVGDSVEILWESSSFDDSVDVEYSTDGGENWNPIERVKGGAFTWLIPGNLSSTCLVRISDYDNGIPSDESDDYFSIVDYTPGDPNGDQTVDLTDALYLLNYLFRGGDAPNPMAAGDANASCNVDLDDAIYLLNYLFRGDDPPQPGCA